MKNKVTKFLVVILTAILFVTNIGTVLGAKNDQGVDWSIYQGAYGKFGYGSDKFSISQVGGHNAGGLYLQSTYNTQVQSTIAQGKRAHSYFWWESIYNQQQADQLLNFILPKIQTPKGSIVAIDFEKGGASYAVNQNLIEYAMQRIKNAGYTPVLYGYKSFLQSNLNTDRIVQKFGSCLWVAEYPNYQVTPKPNYNYFPSMNGVAIFQFTSTYIAGGLDGDVDLTGITDKGYSKNDNPKGDTPAIDNGQNADNESKKDIKVGYTVKVNFSATHWSTGQSIPQFIKGKSYKVQQVSGNKVLLANVLSWINKKDVEILDTNTGNSNGVSNNYYIVRYGENLSSIGAKLGVSWQTLANLNGLRSPFTIYPNQRLLVSRGTQRAYIVRYGENLSSIGAKLGVSWQTLANRNGLRSPYIIYPNQKLLY